MNAMDKSLLDTNLPTLDFRKSASKNIVGLLYISRGVAADKITCEIENGTSFLNDQGEWVALPDISDVLPISVYDGHGTDIPRHFVLNVRSMVALRPSLCMKLR